jgi:hypothetical protein
VERDHGADPPEPDPAVQQRGGDVDGEEAVARSARFRCSSPVTSLDQRGDCSRVTPTTPRATVRVKSASATNPLPRIRYQTNLGVSTAISTALLG